MRWCDVLLISSGVATVRKGGIFSQTQPEPAHCGDVSVVPVILEAIAIILDRAGGDQAIHEVPNSCVHKDHGKRLSRDFSRSTRHWNCPRMESIFLRDPGGDGEAAEEYALFGRE